VTGIICPRCGTPDDTRVVDSRPHTSGRKRRHQCGCSHRFSTIEILLSDKPRTLVDATLRDPALWKAKLIARVSSLLEDSL
jgi:transcriptional regulator NrdR family protein